VTSTPSPHRTGAAPEPGTCPVTTDSAIRRHVWTLSQRPLACEERGVGRSGRRKRAVVRDGDTAAANSIAANCDHCTRDWALGEPWCPMVSTRPHGSCPPVMIGDLSAVCQHKSPKRAYWHGTNTAGLGKVVGSTTGHADVASAARTAWATLSAGLAKRLCARCLGGLRLGRVSSGPLPKSLPATPHWTCHVTAQRAAACGHRPSFERGACQGSAGPSALDSRRPRRDRSASSGPPRNADRSGSRRTPPFSPGDFAPWRLVRHQLASGWRLTLQRAPSLPGRGTSLTRNNG
jgi:hypothetical protein